MRHPFEQARVKDFALILAMDRPNQKRTADQVIANLESKDISPFVSDEEKAEFRSLWTSSLKRAAIKKGDPRRLEALRLLAAMAQRRAKSTKGRATRFTFGADGAPSLTGRKK